MSDAISLNEIWRMILREDIKRWVIFRHGTVVVCTNPDVDIREYAIDLMKKMGIVIPGSSHGDFEVARLDDILGWTVHYHHPDILSYVAPEEVESPDAPDIVIGLIGRKKRAIDAQELEIIHVES